MRWAGPCDVRDLATRFGGLFQELFNLVWKGERSQGARPARNGDTRTSRS